MTNRIEIPSELREAVIREHLERSYTSIAFSAGLLRNRKGIVTGDATRLMRVLGIRQDPCSSSPRAYFNRTIDIEIAERITKAIGLDPVDVGL